MPDGNGQVGQDFLDRRLALIAQATSVPIGTRPLSELADALMEQIVHAFGCDAAVARLLDEDRLVLLASRGVPGRKLVRSMRADDGLAGEMLQKRRPVYVPDVPQHDLTEAKYKASPNAFRFRSFCGTPMLVGDRAVGVLGMYGVSRPSAFSENDLRDLGVVANHIAAAIANAQLYDELKRLNTELERRVADRTAALSRSEARLGLLAEHAIDIISQHTPDGRFAYVSPAVTRELGWDTEELVGKLPREFVHPDDRDAVISARIEMISAGSRTVRREYRFRTRAGGYRWVESASRRIGEIGPNGPMLVVVTRDITQRREAEQRLRLVQAAVSEVREGVVITDAMLDPPGPKILYVNPAFTAMSGYTAREIEGLTPRVLQGPETKRALLDRLKRTLAAGQPFSAETTNYRKDGTPYLVEWNIAPVRQPDGKISHWVSVQRDVTSRRQDEKMAHLHRDQLAHATRLTTMGELASGLAHELNQPLAAIANYAAGALNRLPEPPTETAEASSESVAIARGALERVRTQAGRAGEIIRRLRSFVNRRTAQAQDSDLNSLVREVISLNEADSRMGRVDLRLDLSEGLPACRIDAIQIEQVILNMLRNALDAVQDRPDDQRWIAVRTWCGGEAASSGGQRRWLYLEVTDSGDGLDEEQLRKMFDPFFTTKQEGMGLGITISQSIVDAHGGRLWASRHASGGLSVTMRVPALRDAEHGTPSSASTSTPN